jgi:hypothetical protein
MGAGDFQGLSIARLACLLALILKVQFKFAGQFAGDSAMVRRSH